MAKPRRHPGFCFEKIDQELLLYDPRHDKMLYCNETAYVVWQLCDGERTVEGIIELLSAAFPDSAASIAGDVKSALEDLERHGALEMT